MFTACLTHCDFTPSLQTEGAGTPGLVLLWRHNSFDICSAEDLEGRWGKVISGLRYKETSYWKPFVISCKATFHTAIKSNSFH